MAPRGHPGLPGGELMRIVVLQTGTNNVGPVVDPLTDLGHDIVKLTYDGMTYAEHDQLPALVEEQNPDWVLYVGALAEHHGKPVPFTAVLAQIGANRKLVHLAFDGAEAYWQHRLIDYYDNGRFALMVN